MTEIRSFLGLASYYHRFIPGFSSIALPMTKLIRKNVKTIWSDECEESFILLKEKWVSSTVLIILDGSEDMVIYSDASLRGLGCLLMQRGRVGNYAFRQLKSNEFKLF